jgi:hypothetical protein
MRRNIRTQAREAREAKVHSNAKVKIRKKAKVHCSSCLSCLCKATSKGCKATSKGYFYKNTKNAKVKIRTIVRRNTTVDFKQRQKLKS